MPERCPLVPESTLSIGGVRQLHFDVGNRPTHRMIFVIESDVVTNPASASSRAGRSWAGRHRTLAEISLGAIRVLASLAQGPPECVLVGISKSGSSGTFL